MRQSRKIRQGARAVISQCCAEESLRESVRHRIRRLRRVKRVRCGPLLICGRGLHRFVEVQYV